jgi:hypothetical protein
MKELYFWALLLILCVIPLRDGFLYNQIVGAGPDVISTIWGMWWFQQELSILGGGSYILNYPYGATGNVLSPSSALLFALTEPILGIGRSYALCAWMQIFVFCAGLYLWLKEILHTQFPAMIGAFVPIVGSYFFFGIGEGSLVAIAAIPLPLGLWGLWRISKNWYYVLFVGFCMAWMSIENPYLAPILPTVAVIRWIQGHERKKIFLGLIGGTLAILSVARILRSGANPDYPREVAGQTVALLGRQWDIVDLPWARMGVTDVFWPVSIQWTTQSENAVNAQGGYFLGVSLLFFLVLSINSLRQRDKNHLIYAAWVWLSLGFLLSLGSIFHSLAGPFLFYNSMMDAIARPLTQPTRYLILCVVGFAFLVSLMVQKYEKWQYWFVGGLLLESMLWGGLRLDLPNTKLPQYTCSTNIEGPVLVWPWDAIDGEMSQSQLYQMVHKQPSPHTGIASWALSKKGRVINVLRTNGYRVEGQRIRFSALSKLGYDWIIVERDLPSALDFENGGLDPKERCDVVDLYSVDDLEQNQGPFPFRP